MSGQTMTIMDFTNPSNFQPNPEVSINGNGAALIPVNGVYPAYTEILPEPVYQIPTLGLISLTPNSQIPAGTSINISVIRSSGNWYYNGTAWVEGVGSNAIGTITPAILALLNLSGGETVQIAVWLVANAGGTETPTLISLTVVSTMYLPQSDTLNPTVVYGYIADPSGNPVSGVQVSAALPANEPFGSDTLIVQSAISTTSNAAGYWQLLLLPGEYGFTFTNGANTYSSGRSVPAKASVAYNSLVS
jgi:hypothetical protein